MHLFHCIYCSASAKVELTRDALDALLATCRENNGKIGITGMLLYQNRSFFQVLEGDQKVVESLFAKIAKDKRHVRVTKIISELIEERAFGDWTMGFPKVSSNDLAEIPGLNDFFTRGDSFRTLGVSRARTLLEAFKDGRWRVAQ